MKISKSELDIFAVDLGRLTEFGAMSLFGIAKSKRITEGTGGNTLTMRDENGQLLYPSFYWTHLRVPPQALLSRFGLWDSVAVGVDVASFESTVIDSSFVLGTPEELASSAPTLTTMRSGTAFIVESSRHGDAMPSAIQSNHLAVMPQIDEPPSSMMTYMQVRKAGAFPGEQGGSIRLPSAIEYRLVAGRDVMLGHAVMFATFVKLLEHAERETLSAYGVSGDMIATGEILERETYYLSNAYPGDALRIEASASAIYPPDQSAGPLATPGHLMLRWSHKITRQADNKLLVLARGTKLLIGSTPSDSALFKALATGELKPAAAVASVTTPSAETSHRKIAVASTFTAESIAPALDFWVEKLGIKADLEFAPYAQVFQQLVDPTSPFFHSDTLGGLLLVRFDDWLANRGTRLPDWEGALTKNVRDFAEAVKAATKRARGPIIVVACASSPTLVAEPAVRVAIDKAEAWLVDQVQSLPGVRIVSRRETSELYPVPEYHDADGEVAGHVPYCNAYFTAIGTMAARALNHLLSPRFKVIAVDCDNTLWFGAVGEEGPAGVRVDEARLRLQTLLTKQKEAGRFICLCSKNAVEDVDACIAQRPDFVLKSEHIAAKEIGWHPKSVSLARLSKNLNVGLDSFVYLDDNPVECAEIASAHPSVLTVQAPLEGDRLDVLLRHLWAFDARAVTVEDRQRTEMFKQTVERESFRESAPSLKEFVAGLRIEIRSNEIKPENIERVAQLTQRTNQFNSTTIRRQVGEVRAALEGAMRCLVVDVSDRFGDYGLVGAVFFKPGDTLRVDSFMLSCRVLGRGVEHEIVRRLGAEATRLGIGAVEIPYIKTAKNEPFLRFMSNIAAAYATNTEKGATYLLPTAYASDLVYEPDPGLLDVKESAPKAVVGGVPNEVLLEIATSLNNVETIGRAIKKRGDSRRAEVVSEPPVPPRNDVEKQLMDLWNEVLLVGVTSVHEPFSRLGGSSLQAVQLSSLIRKHFGVRLSFEELLAEPTIAAIALRIAAAKAKAKAKALV